MQENKEIKKVSNNSIYEKSQIFSPELFCLECKIIPHTLLI